MEEQAFRDVDQGEFVVHVQWTNDLKETVRGTGFFVTPRGHIVTALHVVKDATTVDVLVPYTGKRVYRVIEQLPEHDLALLEPPVPPTRATPYARLTDALFDISERDEPLVVLGYSAPEYYQAPQKIPITMIAFSESLGTIGLGGDINPGDSGAPVVRKSGEVVGVVIVRDRNRAGQAMAVPSLRVRELLGRSATATTALGLERRSAPQLHQDVLNSLQRLPRAQFERVLFQLGMPQSALPGYDTSQDARARAFARLVPSLPSATNERVLAAIADARRQTSFTREVKNVIWSAVGKVSRTLYEWLATQNVIAEPLERRAIEEYHQKIDNDLKSDNMVELVEQDVGEVLEPHEDDPFATAERQGIAVRRIRHVLRLLSGISHGGDQASAQLASLNRRSKVVRDAVATLLRSDRPVILLGDPGSGKSMTLREVARELIFRRARGPKAAVVVYVRLSAFTGPLNDIVGLIRSQISSELVRDAVPMLIAERRLIVLFDGMDEMERQRYTERVAELSRFADAYRDSIRMLFSCRINDFTPEFTHRQLVLLPFAGKQIAAFIHRNVRLPIAVNGVTYTKHARLIREIESREGLSELVNNPLMLFLTCQYLRAEASFPGSRAALFNSFIKQTLAKVAKEKRIAFVEGEPESLVQRWSSFAYWLLRHGRPSASLSDLPDVDEEPVQRAVVIGTKSGILTTDGDDSQRIRFSHHRFQEFFAARYLAASGDEETIEWKRVLDLPAWQETLLNLASLKPNCRPLVELQQLIEERSTALREQLWTIAEADDGDDEQTAATQAAKPKRPAWLLDHEMERRWADRVVLASNIIRESRTERTELPEGFETVVYEALRQLATHGRPTSQVKMLWAWRNAPGGSVVDALSTPLDSNIRWVREQAILLIARVGGADLSRNLALELAIDYSQEVFLNRLPTYIRAARSRGPGWMAVVVVAAVCQSAYIALAIGFVLLCAYLAVLFCPIWDVAPRIRNLGDPLQAVALLVLATLVVVPLTVRTLGVVRSAFFAGWYVTLTWVTIYSILKYNVLVAIAAVFGFALTVWIPSVIREIAFWPTFGCVALLSLKSGRVDAAMRIGMRSPYVQQDFKWAGLVGNSLFLAAIGGGYWAMRRWPILNWILGITAGALLVVLYVIVLIVEARQQPRERMWIRMRDRARYLVHYALDALAGIRFPRVVVVLQWTGAVVAGLLLGLGLHLLREPILRFLESCFGFLTLVIIFAVPLVLLVVCIYQLRMILWLVRAHGWWRIDTATWQAVMKTSNPLQQQRYLQVDRSRFSPHPLSPSEYLSLLVAVENNVSEDPAATLYWRLRQEMEQATRHHEQP